MHLTEGRNTGFKKILDALEANGSPKPEFETDEDRSYFITRLFIHEKFATVSDEEPKRSRKKELKESNIRYFDRESYNYSNSAYGNNEFNKKTGTKGYERIAGRRRTYKRRD